MRLAWIARTTDIALLAMVLAGAAGCAVLAAGGTVPDWLLPAALAVAAPFSRALTGEAVTTPRDRRLLLLLGAIAATAFGALAFGATATPSRHWDGAVAWDLKAALLTSAPTLQQPAFADPDVLHHSRDYPLLQPLLVAMLERLTGAGRLLLPLTWLLAAAALFVGAVRRGCTTVAAATAAVAFALTPNLVRPVGGSVDSGYADCLLAACVTVAAAGCLGRDRRWIVLGVVLMVLAKPEGLPYAAALLSAAWLRPRSAALAPVALGLTLGAVVLLPLLHRLSWADRRPLSATLWLVALAPTCLASIADGVVRRTRRDSWRPWIAAGALLLALLAMPLVIAWSGSERTSLARHLHDLAPLLDRLDRLPPLLRAAFDFAFLRGWFALTAPLLLLVAYRRLRHRAGPADLPLATWLLLLLPIWSVTFLASDKDLDLHLRSRLPRLMIHATGLAWACIAAALARRDARSVAADNAAPATAAP